MRLALVTCANLPRPDPELSVLRDAAQALGHDAVIACWEDPAVAWASFDRLLIRSTWNYVQRFAEYSAWLDRPDVAPRLVNPLRTIRWNIHKRYLLELAERGVPVVETALVPAGAMPEWEAIAARSEEIVLKPAISAGSFATVRVRRDELDRAREHRGAHLDRDMLIQPLLRSVVERGERNAVYFAGVFSHAVEKGARWSGDREASRGLVQPTVAERALAARVLEQTASAVGAMPAYARVDTALDDHGRPVLMELELIEPSLFLDRIPGAAPELLRAALAHRL
jgi:hypothetical protein